MRWLLLLGYGLGLMPLTLLLRAHRATSLLHAAVWACVAWCGWALTDFFEASPYVALTLTAGATVAVLGARRPQVGPWNLVVAGFVAVMLLPVAEMWVLGSGGFGGVRLLFLAAGLAVGVGNYLPTRFGPAAGLLLLSLTGIFAELVVDVPAWLGVLGRVGLLATPWLGWFCAVRRSRAETPFDGSWRQFRDGFGFLWAQRLREQFNQACQNSGWPGRLGWSGLRYARAEDTEAMTAVLRKMLGRFGEW